MSPVLTTFLAAVATAAGGALVAAVVNAIRQMAGNNPLRQSVMFVLIGAAVGFTAALVFTCAVNSDSTLTIYSNCRRGLGGEPNKQAGDVKKGIDLALRTPSTRPATSRSSRPLEPVR